MNSLTIRNIPPAVARLIRQRAERERTSLSKAVVSLIEERIGRPRKRTEAKRHDLDFLAGSWTKEEARLFEKSLAEQRVSDPEVWH